MGRHKSRAFVLDAVDYRETSRLLHLFCENEGRISIIAKGLRSPKSKKSQAADTFNLVQVGYSLKDGATLGLLSSIDAEEVYGGIRQNLAAYALASFWFEVLKIASQARMASPELFGLTADFLRQVQRQSSVTSDTATFFLQLAAALGFTVELGHCLRCGRSDGLHRIDLATGSALCTDCAPPRGRTLPYTANLRGVVSAVGAGERVGLSAGDAIAFFTLLQEFLALHLDHRFRTFVFLKQVIAPGAA